MSDDDELSSKDCANFAGELAIAISQHLRARNIRLDCGVCVVVFKDDSAGAASNAPAEPTVAALRDTIDTYERNGVLLDAVMSAARRHKKDLDA